MRTRAVPLVLGWVVACAVGGALGALSGTQSFGAYLFVYGAALGAAQAIVVWRWCRQGLQPAVSWFTGSLVGWTAGALGSALPVVGVWELPWVTLGVGQTPVLFALLGQRPRRVRVGLTAAWVAASAIGALLISAQWGLNAALFQEVKPLLGSFGADVVGLALQTAVLYGVPTGAVLVGITRATQCGAWSSSNEPA